MCLTPEDGTNSPSELGIWVDPPSTALPLTQSPVRLAIGTPTGRSTNSWRVWINGEDVYVACRDNFRELKASLHASGNWRFGIRSEYAKAHPEFVPPGKDRAWKKWTPTLDETNPLVIGFQILCPHASLYLGPEHRAKWNKSVLFAEPPIAESDMAVVSVCVVVGHNEVSFTPNSRGAVLAILPLGAARTVQVIVTHENVGDIPKLFKEAFLRMLSLTDQSAITSDEGVFFVHGNRLKEVPWVGAVPYKRLRPENK